MLRGPLAPLVLLLAIAGACALPPGDGPSDAEHELRRVVAARPGDPAPLYYLARSYAASGQAEPATDLLAELHRSGWRGGLYARDFAGIAADAGYQDVAARLVSAADVRVHSEVAATVDRPRFRPEGIAYDPVTRALFLGDVREGGIVAVSPSGGVSTFADGDGRTAVFGLEVDPARRLLWALVNPVGPPEGRRPRLVGVLLADGASEEVSIDVPGTLLNDLCVRGDVIYATDSREGAVFQIDVGSGRAQRLDLGGDLRGANGVACSAADPDVFVAAWLDVFRYAPDAGTLDRLETPAVTSAGGIDGLYLHRGRLVGIQNAVGMGRVVSLHLDDARRRVRRIDVLEMGAPSQHLPTTGALVGDDLFYLVNSQLDRPDDEASVPIVVRRLPLG